jgi:ribose/xylose/arabinose/galactoside ABC-type transport system permease subunit
MTQNAASTTPATTPPTITLNGNTMVVILLGHIDLSIPWVATIGGITATAVAGWWGPSWTALGMPVALACGALVGLANGFGVAFLRIPSMVFTLGMNAVVQGMVVMYTGGNAPPDKATPILQWLAVRDTLYVPNAVIVWALVGVLVIVALNRTPLGRYVYAIGNSERVTYLSGIRRGTLHQHLESLRPEHSLPLPALFLLNPVVLPAVKSAAKLSRLRGAADGPSSVATPPSTPPSGRSVAAASATSTCGC